ncbi:division/cell wall cluster transcriptional repressor MraZ [Desulfovibrio cuneatus]|uniref:division/cell wall cluster transcriptional repressor MraZ n=1 Tax=Desulfovibrio cuneatus TaxID=159728 RepID=UPI0004803D34|nr:division/cell wall cluster transcriptional repressor MraZ [Desulfovibrio cuneatus]
MYFRGRSLRQLDPKGRLMLTPDFRSAVAAHSPEGRVVLTTYDDCVVGFPFPAWEEFEQKINRIANPARSVRDFRRLVLGGAEEMELDPQGRIRLSREHMQYAGIGKEVVLMGQGPRFEVWAPERLAPVLQQSFDDVAGQIAASGIDFGF